MDDKRRREICTKMIYESETARDLGFQALHKARDDRDVDRAKEMMEEASDHVLQAHLAQNEILTAEAQGEEIKIDVLMVHAHDHMSAALLALDMIREKLEDYR